MAFKPIFQLATDLDLSRAFGSIQMDARFKSKLSEDWAQLQQGQLVVSDELVIIDGRLTEAEAEIVALNGRVDVIEEEIVIIKQRLDDVEAVAYMAVIT